MLTNGALLARKRRAPCFQTARSQTHTCVGSQTALSALANSCPLFTPRPPFFTRVRGSQTALPYVRIAVRFVHIHVWRRPLCSSIVASVCQVMYLFEAQLGGSLPQALLNTCIKSTLSIVHRMQDKFARNGKVVDWEVRATFPPRLANLSSEQINIVADGRLLEFNPEEFQDLPGEEGERPARTTRKSERKLF